MPIELKPVPFPVTTAPMSAPCRQTIGFSLKGKVRRDDHGNAVWGVAIQSYSLEVLQNGNPTHASMSLDQIGLEIVPGGPDDDAAVELTIWRRNHPNDAKDPSWGFRGTVTALIVADLATDGFSVSPGGPVTVTRAGDPKYAGVFVTPLEPDSVPPQTVVVTLPPGRGLRFAGSLMVFGKRADGSIGPLASYDGTLSPDGQTFTTDGPVDLALSTADPSNELMVEVKALAEAPTGGSDLAFTVGDHAPVSVTVNVTDA
ncbi:hypothetical protein ACFV4G_38090 [Kitasatospora sp. NPDC059747]|uniref:hypothetical protein n=1 Tax=Kitasatospora sp. NPDC059747 TaxID=3346930 RepID=UPI00364AB3DE